MNKKNSIIKNLSFILVAIFTVGIVCICAYAYSLINSPDIITLGVGESYTLSTRSDVYTVRSYDASVITPANSSTVSASAVGDAVVCVKYTYFDRDFYRFRVIDAPDNVTVSDTKLTLGVDETHSINANSTVSDHNFDITYTSTDETVATVSDSGEITSTGVGECDIVCSTYNGATAKCKVEVLKSPEKLTLNYTDVALGESETFCLEPQFAKNQYSGTITYVSSNDDIVSVDDGTITAKSIGKCTVTATTHNGKIAKCNVTVKKMPQELKLLILDKYNIGTDINILTDMSDDFAAHNIDIAVSDDKVLSIDKDDPMTIHCIKKGESVVTLTLSNGVTAQKTIKVSDYKGNEIDFDILNQFPSLPTGCEVVSLTSVLNHYSFDVGMTTMADKYMPKAESNYFSVSPHDYFLGTPYTWEGGMGCFSGCIVKTAHNYFDDKDITNYTAVDITGCSVDELYNYLENDIPVITWVTSGFVTPTVDGSWMVGDELITWCNHEHCLVTTGYNKQTKTVTVGDDSGGYSYTVSMDQFERVFEGMGSMAVVVLKH